MKKSKIRSSYEKQESLDFLREFYSKYTLAKNRNAVHELESTQLFLDKLKPELFLLTERRKNEGKHYNIFEILKIQSLEARVHSPYITHLLDPNASHNMGRVFLDLFLKNVGLINALNKSENWKFLEILDELVLSGNNGRADIYLKLERNSQQIGIIIENKIDAPDQDGQLNRYYKYLNMELGFPEDRLFLFYLTKYGHFPSDSSISDKNEINPLNKEILLKNIHIISYKREILEWLKECINQPIPSRIKNIIEQYIITIKNL